MSSVKSTPTAAPVLYKPPKLAPLPADYEEFMASLTETERELMVIATRELKSSFFVQWCHGYRKWQKTKAAAAAAKSA